MLKKVIMLALLTVPAIGQLCAQGIDFNEGMSWLEVKEKAAKEKKLIFIDVHATWCGPCHLMDKQVFTDPGLAEFMNQNFVSVRVQQDRTPNDSPDIKKWYEDAARISAAYKVEVLPTFLFLDAEGKLQYKGMGYQDVGAFRKMAEGSISNPHARFPELLANYRSGKMKIEQLPELITLARETEGNDSLINKLAVEYKTGYLDKLSKTELLDKKHLDFIGDHFSLIKLGDSFFQLCYEQPQTVDEIKQYEGGGWADFQVIQVLNREIINSFLWNGNKKVSLTPNWKALKSRLKKDYPRIAERAVLENQVVFYGQTDNWKEFAKYREMQIKSYPPKSGAGYNSDAWVLNSHAWMVFENTADRKTLKRALKWSELSIKLEKIALKGATEEVNVQYYDTKANLLYRLGKVKQAIALENYALKIDADLAKKEGRNKGYYFDTYTEIIRKMEQGLATWPIPAVSKK